jgi:hypothetical protein
VLATDDGWSATGATLAPGLGVITLQPSQREVVLLSPPNLALRKGDAGLLVVGAAVPEAVERVRLEMLDDRGQWRAAGEAAGAAIEREPAGLVVPIAWPAGRAYTEQVRVVLQLAAQQPVALRHVALYRTLR